MPKKSKGNTPKTPPATKSNEKTNPNMNLESSDLMLSPRTVSLCLVLIGDPPTAGEFNLLVLFNGLILLEKKWHNDSLFEIESLPMNLRDPYFHIVVASKPLIFILRSVGGKPSKEQDPLNHPENRAGACVDLFPLLLGEEEIFLTSYLTMVATGALTKCAVSVHAISLGTRDDPAIPLSLTMISAHCLPAAKDGTVYISAIGLNGIHNPKAINFYMSLSSATAKNIVWATASTGGFAANTAISVPTDDRYIPGDLTPENTEECRSVYWNAFSRVLVDADLLRQRLSSPFLIEIAGVPRTGKQDMRGRYMGLVDAGVLLEPGQMSVTVCTKLMFFKEANLPDQCGALLELPAPHSAKSAKSAKSPKTSGSESEFVIDEFGHNAYVVIRYDLTEALNLKSKLTELYEIIGFPPPVPYGADEHADTEEAPQDTIIDVRKVRKEAGALAVHKELRKLACKGAVPMNQGIKRTAANRLLMRVRVMLKSFPPGDCSYIDWQDVVTGQHAASRRAVTASFAPQPPPLRLPNKTAAARCRSAGDTRLAEKHMKISLKVAGNQVQTLISKTLRCLEERNDMDAKNYLLEALSLETRNRWLLWILGGQEFDQDTGAPEIAGAALRIAVKGEYSDGTANAIGWAALHAFHHCNENVHAAFIAAKRMRKAYELPTEWTELLERWIKMSGEEEIYWSPSVISYNNPILIAAAFFLCLRCYKFCERLLQCVEQNCATRGSSKFSYIMGPDIYYIRAASLLLRRQLDSAMDMTIEGIKAFGPSSMLSQMRATCLICIRNWDRYCEIALLEADRAGAEPCPTLLYKAALSKFKTDPDWSLQLVARAHKVAPSAHKALLIGRIYARLGEEGMAERWLAAAVKSEPLLADAWAMLCLLAMYEKDLNKARALLRTARQVGPVSPDIDEEVKKTMEIVQLDQLPDLLVKNLCLCEFCE